MITLDALDRAYILGCVVGWLTCYFFYHGPLGNLFKKDDRK